MARAGFVLRFLKLCAVAALLAVVGACGGDGAPNLPEVVRVTVAGMPTSPLAPMQTAQLTATAAYSDGAVKDVTAAATWDSTDRTVVTVSAAGLLTATGPGNADVSAAFGGMRSSVSSQVVALSAAYFSDGLEYAFDYQLDAQGRVDNYRIVWRDGVSYPTVPTADPNVRECTGSLRGSYVCSTTNTAGGYYHYSMTGEQGRLVSIVGTASVKSFGDSSFTFTYGLSGLMEFKEEWLAGGVHWIATDSVSMAYDALGRLTEVRTVCRRNMPYTDYSRMEKTARIDLDSQGRLLHEDVSAVVIYDPYLPVPVSCPPDTTAWTYDEAGHMKTAGSTEYTADADGWLTSRRRVAGAETITDTYVVTRFGGRVAEEQFTQAEPRAFYGESRPQRVRYEWGRLPVEPLFVPRALTGLSGADYLGIISSHHR